MPAKFRTQVEEMDSSQKEWFATAIVTVVVADGAVSKGEMDSLLGSIAFVQDPAVMHRLKNYIHYKKTPPLGPFNGWENDLKKRAAIMLDLVQVAIADHNLSPEEKEVFYKIGDQLKFTRAKIDDLFVLANKLILNPS